MQLSSALCRTQQAIHVARAADATLDNVRRIAESAAKAWGLEALAADERESRLAKRVRAAAGDSDLPVSENPDRGRADAPVASLV